jgi:hypothetical protein
LDEILVDLIIENHEFNNLAAKLFKDYPPYKGIYSFTDDLFVKSIYLNN